MIKHLLYKELKLFVHPTLYIFMCFGVMLLIPAYPFSVTFFYLCLAFFFCFLSGRENRDEYFTVLLPIRRRDAVLSKTLFLILFETAYLIAQIPFAVLRFCLGYPQNPVGSEPNLFYFGIGLLIFGFFNATFLSEFFKSCQKVGKSFLIALIPIFAVILIAEALPHFSALSFLAEQNLSAVALQTPFFFGGAAEFCLLSFFGYRAASHRFERADL